MKKILKVDNPNDYARFVDAPVLHPLLSIIHYDELAPFRHSLNNYGVYGLFIQRQFPSFLSYGMKTLQVSDASIIAVGPGQIGGQWRAHIAERMGAPVVARTPSRLRTGTSDRPLPVLLLFLYRFPAYAARRMAMHNAVGHTDAPGTDIARRFSLTKKHPVGLSASRFGILQPHLSASDL